LHQPPLHLTLLLNFVKFSELAFTSLNPLLDRKIFHGRSETPCFIERDEAPPLFPPVSFLTLSSMSLPVSVPPSIFFLVVVMSYHPLLPVQPLTRLRNDSTPRAFFRFIRRPSALSHPPAAFFRPLSTGLALCPPSSCFCALF